MSSDDVTVTVEKSGRVIVNGRIAAEVSAGVTDTRDELEHGLFFHRVVNTVFASLNKLSRELDGKKAEEVAEGFVDGFNKVTKEINSGGTMFELPPKHGHDYRAGYDAGKMLASMRSHLAEKLNEANEPESAA